MTSGRGGSRIVMDVTLQCCWEGHPTGILRVERELAIWAHRHAKDVDFAFFDPARQVYRQLDKHWLGLLVTGDCVIDLRGLPDPNRTRKRSIERVPRALRSPVMWILQFRRQLLHALERARLSSGNRRIASAVDRLQRSVMSKKYRQLLIKKDGTRRAFLQVDMALGDEIEFSAGDILLAAGCGWSTSNISRIEELKAARSIRFAVLCYDIIVLQFPQFWRPHDVATFKSYFDKAIPASDLVMFTARQIEQDGRHYCNAHGLSLRRTAIVPLGANPVQQPSPTADVRNRGLQPGKYILFVSTIEPRKGHRVLLEAWRRLKHESIVRDYGFKLALVGRPGWLVEDLLADLAVEQETGSLVVLSDIDDGELAAIYRDSAFCVFPSEYEGFGLPVVEAFQYGKAVIASTGGAVPEVAGGLMPCLDPKDVDAWTTAIRQWITQPAVRLTYEETLRTHYRPVSWEDAATRIFETVRNGISCEAEDLRA
jgi:glycosyltransferase involved in cell wall biosynthesis